MFESIEVWGVYDEDGGWRRDAIGTVLWTFDKEEAGEWARKCHLCEFDAVKTLPDVTIASIPDAAETLKNLLEIRRLRNLVRASEHEMVKGWNNRER